MMHYAALCAEARRDQELQGWKPDMNATHDWNTMVGNVQSHIKGLNWGYKADLIKMKAKYYNSYATFVDAHTVSLDNGKGKVSKLLLTRLLSLLVEDLLTLEFQEIRSLVSPVTICSH